MLVSEEPEGNSSDIQDKETQLYLISGFTRTALCIINVVKSQVKTYEVFRLLGLPGLRLSLLCLSQAVMPGAHACDDRCFKMWRFSVFSYLSGTTFSGQGRLKDILLWIKTLQKIINKLKINISLTFRSARLTYFLIQKGLYNGHLVLDLGRFFFSFFAIYLQIHFCL